MHSDAPLFFVLMEAPLVQLVQDVIPLLPPKPAQLIAARLCNFPTGHSAPLLSKHSAWIKGDLIKATVDRHADFWIDIQAYASKTGSERLNQRFPLIDARRSSVTSSRPFQRRGTGSCRK